MVLSGKMPPPPSIPVPRGGSLHPPVLPAGPGESRRPTASPAPHGDSRRPTTSPTPRGDSLRTLATPIPARGGSLRPPPERVGGMTCRELVEIASLPHYQLRVDRKCRLVMARRTTTPFQGISEIRDCFRDIQIKLADIPRRSYHLLVDARFGPSRNDRGFELVLEEERGKLLFGFARNAALAATAAGRLQIQRFAKQDGREVFATDDPSQAFDYLGLRPHLV